MIKENQPGNAAACKEEIMLANLERGGFTHLYIRVHEVKIQIPYSINLIVTCVCGEKKVETMTRRKIDLGTKIAVFNEEIAI